MKIPNQSLNQTGKTMRFCVKVSAGAKASEPAGYLNRYHECTSMEGFGFSEIVFISIILILSIFALVYWIKALIRCVHSETDISSKTIWIILMLVTGILGSFFYNSFGTKERSEKGMS